MKKSLFILFSFLFFYAARSQQLYHDFEGTKVMSFGWYSGTLDSLVVNPAPNTVNNSANCARYIRDTVLYDNIKFYPDTKLLDITPYQNNSFQTPKIKMKVYSTAPIGTMLHLQLGTSLDNNYPTGSNSEFVAATTTKNAWEQVTFNFYQLTPGGLASPTDIDKLVFLFDPGDSTANDTIYIDDIIGPALANTAGIAAIAQLPPVRLFQNSPNPVRDGTRINFQMSTAGHVSLRVYDLLGNPVLSLVDQPMKSGSHSVPVPLENIPNGIYFYILKKDGVSQAMKMTVSR